MNRAIPTVLLVAALAATAACQGNKPVPDQSQEETDLSSGPADLYDNTFWVITQLRGVDIPDRAECGIAFNEQGQANGRSGVNDFFSQTTAGPGDSLTFGLIGSTKMAGPKADMEFEKAFFDMLHDTKRFHLSANTLEFLDASGHVIAKFRRQESQAPGT